MNFGLAQHPLQVPLKNVAVTQMYMCTMHMYVNIGIRLAVVLIILLTSIKFVANHKKVLQWADCQST